MWTHAVFGASGPDPPKAPKTSAKPAPAKAAPTKAASAKTAPAIAASTAASAKASAKPAPKATVRPQEQPIDRLRQTYEQARKASVSTPNNDDDDMPSLCSTGDSIGSDNDDDDDEYDSDDDASVVSLDLTQAKSRKAHYQKEFSYTVTPLSGHDQASASHTKAKGPAAGAANADKDSKAPAKVAASEPLFREESRGPLASMYGATAATVAKAAAATQEGQFFKGAFDKGSAASKQSAANKSAASNSSKVESGRNASQGFNMSAAIGAQSKPKVTGESQTGLSCCS